ncbi:MAG: hypothetical protein U0R64_01270 [Candidatus Nanopelagicales bacterium]
MIRRKRQEPERYLFVHLQKTAGTSLRAELMQVFPGRALYPNPADGDPVTDAPQIDVDRLVRVVDDPRRRRRLRMVIGHFPLATRERLSVPFVPITVLREPVSRTLSYLRHYRVRHPDLAEVPAAELYGIPDVHRIQVRNHMTKMLGMTSAEMTAGLLTDLTVTSEHLERAVAAVRQMPVVGVVEEFDRFRSDLQRVFGWELPAPVRVNTTVSEPVDAELVERIREDNALDVALYASARERIG